MRHAWLYLHVDAQNTSLDLYHLLITSKPTANNPCVFTVLTKQDSGQFMMGNDSSGAMGPLDMEVYRAFDFAQTGEIEEFETAAGVPYWYNRRTGAFRSVLAVVHGMWMTLA